MKNKVLPFILKQLVRMLKFTYRFEFIGTNKKDYHEKLKTYSPYVFAMWHQNAIGCLCHITNLSHVVMVSPSRDGELIAAPIEGMGHTTVRGSSSRDGVKAATQMMDILKNGGRGVITLDGPRGPKYSVKYGIINITKDTNSNIVPLVTYPKSFWSFNSWDEFRFPKPFTKIYVLPVEPIKFDSDLPKENFDQACEQVKNALIDGERKILEYIGE